MGKFKNIYILALLALNIACHSEVNTLNEDRFGVPQSFENSRESQIAEEVGTDYSSCVVAVSAVDQVSGQPSEQLTCSELPFNADQAGCQDLFNSTEEGTIERKFFKGYDCLSLLKSRGLVGFCETSISKVFYTFSSESLSSFKEFLDTQRKECLSAQGDWANLFSKENRR